MIAANGLQLLQPALVAGDGWTNGLRVVGLAVAALGAWLLLSERRRIGRGGPRRADPTVLGLRTAATIMGVVAFLALANPPARSAAPLGRCGGFGLLGNSPFRLGPDGGRVVDANTRGGDPMVRSDPTDLDLGLEPIVELEGFGPQLGGRLAGLIQWLVIIAIAAMLARRVAGMLDQRLTPPEGLFEFNVPLPPVAARMSLAGSLEELGAFGDDPRGRITAAYHRLLGALAEGGAPREPHEAPHEHLHRVFGPFGVRPEPLHRLAALYVLAQFGDRPVDEEHRAAAAAALSASLTDLEAGLAEHLPGTEEEDEVPGAYRVSLR